MNIIGFLRDQHREVRSLLDDIITRSDSLEHRRVLEKMSKSLRLHMLIEETILYPAASRCFEGNRQKVTVLQSYEEHEVAKQALSLLESTSPNDEYFAARAGVLKGILREHVLEEESELFPSLATKLGQSGIDELGNELERQMVALEAKVSAPRATRKKTRVPKARSAKIAPDRRRRAGAQRAKASGSQRKASPRRSAKGQ
jgi:iron-sulfur cluster repair protein YtfE (RIC family)